MTIATGETFKAHARGPIRPRGIEFHDASKIEADLRRSVKGVLRFDRGSRALYATDGSNYRQVPIGVVIPEDLEDVIATVAACREHGASILFRGGGTSPTGGRSNVAVVMDFSKKLHHTLWGDPDRELARVQPGTPLDHLRFQAEKHGLTSAPDPSTHHYCTLGGMIGNNSCAVHSRSDSGRGGLRIRSTSRTSCSTMAPG